MWFQIELPQPVMVTEIEFDSPGAAGRGGGGGGRGGAPAAGGAAGWSGDSVPARLSRGGRRSTARRGASPLPRARRVARTRTSRSPRPAPSSCASRRPTRSRARRTGPWRTCGCTNQDRASTSVHDKCRSEEGRSQKLLFACHERRSIASDFSLLTSNLSCRFPPSTLVSSFDSRPLGRLSAPSRRPDGAHDHLRRHRQPAHGRGDSDHHARVVGRAQRLRAGRSRSAISA